MRRTPVVLAIGFLLLAGQAGAQADTAMEYDSPQPPVKQQRAPARAREAPTNTQRVQGFSKRLLAGIDLSAEQSQRIDAIQRTRSQGLDAQQQRLMEKRQQMQDARKEGDADKVRKYGEELRAMRQETPDNTAWISEMRAVLTPDQQKQFDANRERMQQASRQQRAPVQPRNPNRPRNPNPQQPKPDAS